MGYLVSSEEDLVALSVSDRKPGQHFAMPHKEDTKRVGRNKYTRFDGLRDNNRPHYSNNKLKNQAEGDPYIGEDLQEFGRANVLDLRKRSLKLNPSNLRAGLEQRFHKNKKDGRGALEGEVELKSGRFNVKPSQETNQEEQIFQDSTQVGSLVCTRK
jgi:hypothetical protein